MREAKASIDSAEFTAWRAFDRVEPFGDARADWRVANVARVYFNAKRDPNSERCKTSDFMWDYKAAVAPPVPEQSDDAVAAGIDAAFSAMVKRAA